MKIESKKKMLEKQELDFIINADDNIEIILSEKESEDLINRLNKGANDKAKKFIKESMEFYNKMKKKEEIYKNI